MSHCFPYLGKGGMERNPDVYQEESSKLFFQFIIIFYLILGTESCLQTYNILVQFTISFLFSFLQSSSQTCSVVPCLPGCVRKKNLKSAGSNTRIQQWAEEFHRAMPNSGPDLLDNVLFMKTTRVCLSLLYLKARTKYSV